MSARVWEVTDLAGVRDDGERASSNAVAEDHHRSGYDLPRWWWSFALGFQSKQYQGVRALSLRLS